jgi:hypothetical protein
MTYLKMSIGTRPDVGRNSRAGFLGPMKTRGKLRITFRSYLGNRFGVEKC